MCVVSGKEDVVETRDTEEGLGEGERTDEDERVEAAEPETAGARDGG